MDNSTDKILPLPFQKQKITDVVSDDDLMFQYRITITDFLNKVNSGHRHITPEIMTAIEFYNQMARKHGYTPIKPNL